MNGEMCREKILSEDYWDFLIPGYRSEEEILLPGERGCFQGMDFGYRTLYVDSKPLGELSIGEYWYNSIPNCYALLDMEALNAAGIRTVQTYPSLQLSGENIMIGFLDTGIDYRHPVFRNIDGSTRIVGIWDQTDQTGNPPEGLDYGSVYTKEQIDEALRESDPFTVVPQRDENGHGTYLASVAAGGADVENGFSGAAPEASLAVVKLKPAKRYLKQFYGIREDAVCYQENDIMLGLRYLNQVAKDKRMPLVICLALGTNFGGHNGTTLLSIMLDRYAAMPNRTVVMGTGNEAAERHHYRYVLTDKSDVARAEIRVGEGVGGFAAEVWTGIPNVVTVSITSPSGEQSRKISLRQGDRYHLMFSFDRTEVTLEYRLLLENNDSQLIFLRFHEPAAGIWRIDVAPIQLSDGEIHIWLPIQEFLSGEVYFLEADPNVTLTEPGTGQLAMTAAYYNGTDNGVDIHSGRGYTRNGRTKPDYAAPGVQVLGAGLDGRFVTRSGSSVATGIAAGASALLMEWVARQPGIHGMNSIEIRNMIVLGANQREGMEYPNREWGYGTLNLYQSLDILRGL